jgi:hypothetical protein
MTMHSALYYPHTDVKSKSIIKNALLSYDILEYIVPFADYKPNYLDTQTSKAMEIIGKGRVPTIKEKNKVHELVKDQFKTGIPEVFKYAPRDTHAARNPEYEIWPQKFAPATWDFLTKQGLTNGMLDYEDYPMREATGLSLMAILADVLGGETRARVTDRGLAYVTIANVPKNSLQSEESFLAVGLTLQTIGIADLSIERLIAFREQEAKSGGSDYMALRHKYVETIENHIRKISEVGIDSADRTELDRVFAQTMDSDLSDLKSELGFAKREAWLSKDTIALVVAGGALLAAANTVPFAIPAVVSGGGAIAVLGGVFGTANKFAKSRYEIMRKHPMAYLHRLSNM